MKSATWSHRGIQLDLARQYERPDQIKRFITLAATWGFTHVYLYIEGRIRTASFPYPEPATSYDAKTMKMIVRHAKKKSIELVPVVPCFGHVEQFIQHKPLAHLAEIPKGGPGRFGKSHGTCACPTNPATFKFFTQYYREIAAIFPSQYFHIGMDEAFDVGLCPACKQRQHGFDPSTRLRTGEANASPGGRRSVAAADTGLDTIFADYVTRIARFVERELGRTVLMWDDMLEACPNAINNIPTSIILCVWLYDEVFDKPWSRFFNRTRADLIPFYASHGFKSIASCRDVSLLNVDSVANHGRSSNACIGGLVTSWEHSTDFLEQFHPIMAYAAQLWTDAALQATDSLKRFFGNVPPDVLEALKQALSRRTWMRHTTVAGHSRGFPTLQDHERRMATDHIRATLRPIVCRTIKPAARHTWDCIHMDLEFESIHHTLSSLIPNLKVGLSRRDNRLDRTSRRAVLTDKKTLLAAATRLDTLARHHKQFWNRVRRNIPLGPLPSGLTQFAKEIRELAKTSATKKHWLIRIHGFLPDRFGVPIVDVAVQLTGSNTWRSIHHGSIKTFWDEQPYYEYWITTPDWPKAPKALRIQVTGHGGHGFRYVEIETPKGRYIPTRILSTHGIVEHPEKLLIDDKRWTWLGLESVREAYDHPMLRQQKHQIVVDLAPA